MVVDANPGNHKTIEIKPVTIRQDKSFARFMKRAIIILNLIAFTALAIHFFVLPRLGWFQPKPAPTKPADASFKPQPLEEAVPPLPAAPVTIEPLEKEEAAPVEKTPEFEREISVINERLTNLEQGNHHLFVYFAARDLKDSIEDPENFKDQLALIRDELGNDANVSGKIDILEQATANGIVTRAMLLDELSKAGKNISKNQSETFSGSIKSAFGNLIKVSKIEGNVEATDYNSIIKRAELYLTNEKLNPAGLQRTINEVAAIGKPAENFVREANNLQRVLEVTDFLVTYTKSKVTEK